MIKKKRAKILIIVAALIVCLWGGLISSEPLNYVLWALIFLVVPVD